MSESVFTTERQGRVLLMTINRPEARNAINRDVSQGLAAAIEELDTNNELSAGVITGAGGSFSAGMDLKAFARGEDIGPFLEFCKDGAKKPLIAAIEGAALAGGLELAMACDLLVASKGAKLGIPEVKRGLFAAGGGLLRLPSRVGFGKAMELALTGNPITAEEAAEFGLVCRVADEGGAVTEAMALAAVLAENGPLALAASKQLIRATQGATEAEYWDLQNAYMGVFASNDAQEGPKAFAEKRKPEWTGT